MKKFRFLDWPVYKDAQKLFALALKITKELPREFRFELGSQVVRSSYSVILNIAEGSGKISDRELNRFIDIALGSVYETVAGIDTIRLAGFANEKDFTDVKDLAAKISDQLGGFKKVMDK